MARLISISDLIDRKLVEIKGNGSYSAAIALLMTKCGIELPDNLPRLPSNSTAIHPKRGE